MEGLDIDVLVIQSTGAKYLEINKILNWYIKQKLPFPKNIISVNGDEHIFLNRLIEEAPYEIGLYEQPYVLDNNIEISRWLGVEYQKKGKRDD